jgi:hypothetical protein
MKANLTEMERKGIVRDLALALVQHMEVEKPPVWVETLLKDPPTVYRQRFPLAKVLHKVIEIIFVWPSGQGSDLLIPSGLPLVERRFVLAKELLNAMLLGLKEQSGESSKFLLPDLKDMSSYFARVLLAPDPFVEAYRAKGLAFTSFAKTFLLPESVASIRWQDPIFPVDLNTEDFLGKTFSFS